MRKERTCQDIIMSQLSANTAHINNVFGAHNVGVIMGMSCMQYSGSYGVNFFGTSSINAPPVDRYIWLLHFQLHILIYIIHKNIIMI